MTILEKIQIDFRERIAAPTTVISAAIGFAMLCPCPVHITTSAVLGIPLAILSFFFPDIKNMVKAYKCKNECKCDD